MSFNPGLEIGQVITTDDINKIFGVDKTQGIRSSVKFKYIVIVSNDKNGEYNDEWVDDHLIYYTGYGLYGDQKMTGRNKTLANANIDNKELFFFEKEGVGKYIYRGICDLIGEPFTGNQKDKNGNMRLVYLFPLKLRIRRKKLLLTKKEKAIYDEIEQKYNCEFFDLNKKESHHRVLTGYKSKPQKPKKPVIKDGIKIYPRNRKTALNALIMAGHQCEYNSLHESFIRKSVDLKYVEPHHLIPMSFSDQFNVSLDVEENIVSLCSDCHNRIHYGKDRYILLKKLYDERIDVLKLVGIDITFEELKLMYS